MFKKIINGDVEIDPNNLFTFPNNCNTRGHKYKLLKKSVCVHVCKYSFANRIFTAWNNFPVCVIESVNVNIFMTRDRLNTANLRQYWVIV